MDETKLADMLECFDEDQKTALISLLKKDESSEDDLEIVPRDKHLQKDAKRVSKLDSIWRNNGYVDGVKEQITVTDLIEKDMEVRTTMKDNFSTDMPLILPRVIENIAREAIEPQLVLTPLLSRINFSAGTRVVFPSWGGFTAADIPEGGEYPERSLDLAGQVEAIIGKSGVACKFTDEMIRYSQFDVMSMHIRAAGRALARWKEQKVADLIVDNGTTIINNDSTAIKSSTGRDASGAYNGTLTLDDLFYAYATMLDTGFTPNALIMHPFAWQIFSQEAIARAFGFANGVNPLMWQTAKGAPGNANPWRMGNLNQNTYVSSPQNIATTFTDVPSIFPTNFRVIVTPYMSYNASTKRTDIVLCDLNELGIMVVDEDVMSEEWDDPARDIRKIKFRERYGLAVMNDGKGIGLLKDINVARGFDFTDKISLQYTSNASSQLSGSITGDASHKANV